MWANGTNFVQLKQRPPNHAPARAISSWLRRSAIPATHLPCRHHSARDVHRVSEDAVVAPRVANEPRSERPRVKANLCGDWLEAGGVEVLTQDVNGVETKARKDLRVGSHSARRRGR